MYGDDADDVWFRDVEVRVREGKGVLGVAMGVVSFAPGPTASLTLRGSRSGCLKLAQY
jgi:hypothetical protein